MHLFEFLGNIATSILIGYLALTNVVVDRVHALLGEDPVATEEVAVNSDENALTTVPGTAQSDGVIPRILLENPEFQRAAVAASDEKTPVSYLDGSIALSDLTEKALVNIYCQYRTEDYIRTTTGSGYLIHPNGVIITNAHVAQFLLLKDLHNSVIDATCVVRAGNPATPTYKAELLYISPEWISENAKLIAEETPRGTGERDYALLYIKEGLGNKPLPGKFPFISINTNLLSRATKGTEVLSAGYPAEALFRDGSGAKLTPVIASTTVSELYTFGSNYADVFSVTDSAVGAQGASGGPVIRPDGGAIGLIVTKGDVATEGERSLRALTLSYIDRTITEETGFPLMQNMQGDLAYRGNVFKKALVPFLSKILLSEIVKEGGD